MKQTEKCVCIMCRKSFFSNDKNDLFCSDECFNLQI